jgi:profilin
VSLFQCFLQVTKEELAKLVQGFDKTEILTSGGVTLAGQRHIYLSGTDRVIRAKLGKIGVHCMKTQQGKDDHDDNRLLIRSRGTNNFFYLSLSPTAVIVAIYEEPVQPQQAASVVEKLGDYLITCGY